MKYLQRRGQAKGNFKAHGGTHGGTRYSRELLSPQGLKEQEREQC